MDLKDIKFSNKCDKLFTTLDIYSDNSNVDILSFLKSRKIKYYLLDGVYEFILKLKTLKGEVIVLDFYDKLLVFPMGEKELTVTLKKMYEDLKIDVGLEYLEYYGYENNYKELKRIATKLGYKVSKI